MNASFAVAALMWAATIAYAMVESGIKLIGHCQYGTMDALLGRSSRCVPGLAQPISPAAGTGNPGTLAHGEVASRIVSYAQAQLGKPYRFAGPTNGSCDHPNNFDCSGLTKCAVNFGTSGGLNLAHHAATQMATLARWAVPKRRPALWEAGDLIFYYHPTHHCAVYIGGGKIIAAPHTGTVVQVEDANIAPIVGVRRPAKWARGAGTGNTSGPRSKVVPMRHPRRQIAQARKVGQQ